MGMEIPGVVPSGIHSELQTDKRLGKVSVKNLQAATPKAPPERKEIERAVAQLEKMVAQFNRRFEISINKSINRIVVKVIDSESDKVIKEIPPEEIQHLAQKLQEMMGLLVDEKI
jgi:flagellar protein FlaG